MERLMTEISPITNNQGKTLSKRFFMKNFPKIPKLIKILRAIKMNFSKLAENSYFYGPTWAKIAKESFFPTKFVGLILNSSDHPCL